VRPMPAWVGIARPPTIVRNIAAIASGEITARLVAFAATALLTRRLGPEGFGIVGFATAIAGYLTLAVNSGLNEVGGREVARDSGSAHAIYAGVLTIRLAIAAAALGVLGVVSVLLPLEPQVRLVVFLSGLSFVSLAADPSWVYRGLERPVGAAAQVLAQLLYVAGVATLVHDPSDVTRVPVAQFGGEIVAALVFGLPLLGWRWPGAAWALGRRLLASAGFLTASRVLRTLILTFDVVFLGFTVAAADVGLYTAAYRFCFLLMAIGGAVNAGYLPSFTRAAAEGPTAVRDLLSEALRTSLMIGAPLVAGSIAIAGPLLGLLFGRAFEPGAPAFMLLLVSIGCYFVHGVLGNVFLVMHRTRLQAGVYGVAAVLNVVMNLVAIPRYGIVGAAAATLVAEGTIVVLGLVAMRRLGVAPAVRPLIAPVVAAALMAGTLLVMGSGWPILARILAGVVLYGVALGPLLTGRPFERS
jgi:O-antigen/teichoic acid export membrane protein